MKEEPNNTINTTSKGLEPTFIFEDKDNDGIVIYEKPCDIEALVSTLSQPVHILEIGNYYYIINATL